MRSELAFLSASLTAGVARARDSESEFTDAQAERVRDSCRRACAAGRRFDLEGSSASALVGPSFARGWNPGNRVSDFSVWRSSSVDDLFFIMRTTMPRAAEASVSDAQHPMDGSFCYSQHSGAPTAFVFAIPEPTD